MEQIFELLETLSELGRMITIYYEWEDEINEIIEVIEEMNINNINLKNINSILNNKINYVKNKLNNIELYKDNFEDFKYTIREMNDFVYYVIAIDYLLENYKKFNNEIIHELEDIFDKYHNDLLDWFYYEFNSCRLIVYKEDIEDVFRGIINSELNFMFPWIIFVKIFNITIDDVIFGIINKNTEHDEEIEIILELSKDDKEFINYIQDEIKFIKTVIKTIHKKPYLITIYRICEVDREYEIPDKFDTENKYYYACIKLIRHYIVNDKKNHIVICFPMKDNLRVKILKKIVKNEKDYTVNKIEKIFEEFIENLNKIKLDGYDENIDYKDIYYNAIKTIFE